MFSLPVGETPEKRVLHPLPLLFWSAFQKIKRHRLPLFSERFAAGRKQSANLFEETYSFCFGRLHYSELPLFTRAKRASCYWL